MKVHNIPVTMIYFLNFSFPPRHHAPLDSGNIVRHVDEETGRANAGHVEVPLTIKKQ